jgi:hypothetical protein
VDNRSGEDVDNGNKGKRGPKPNTVKIDAEWENAVSKALNTRKPNNKIRSRTT